ncbi:hypothetical protein ACA910_022261 [Epithemia clementina (nom. ined.)]
MIRFLDEGDEYDTQHQEDESHDENEDKPWGHVFAASLMVQMVTLIGVFVSFLVGSYSKKRMKGGSSSIWVFVQNIVIPSFAAGALLATAAFLLVPESLELIGSSGQADHAEAEGEHVGDEPQLDGEGQNVTHRYRTMAEVELSDENDGAWHFGASLLCGFLLPALLHAIFSVHLPEDGNHNDDDDLEKTEELIDGRSPQDALQSDSEGSSLAENEDVVTSVEGGSVAGADENSVVGEKESGVKVNVTAIEQPREMAQPRKNWGLAMSILAGDFFHNFTDGIFIGTSFILCGSQLGFTVTATTVYHELAQEIGDFILLTHHCNLMVSEALLLNFLSGVSIFLGAIAVLSSDIEDKTQGVILAMSAGVYFYLGGVECIPRVQRVLVTSRDNLAFLVSFIIGAVPIGLVLLNHGHCEAQNESADEHGR